MSPDLIFLRNLQKALNNIDLDLRSSSTCPYCGRPRSGLVPAGKTSRQTGLCHGGHVSTDMHKPMGYAGLVQTRRNRIIPGAWLSLYRATPACLDPSGGEWVTVCEAHGTLCNHETRRLAESHLSYADWCEECQDLVSK